MTKYSIKKEKDFVQIPNSILTSPDISLKAKGILALMLSLPDNWNFSIEGIASKCKESRESIRTAIKELEAAGYIKRTMIRASDGKIIRMEYEIFEEPCKDKPCTANPSAEKPSTEKPSLEKPTMDNPSMEKPSEGNPRVNNIKINNTENNNIQSNPISSNQRISFKKTEMELYRDVVKENIEYEILAEQNSEHKDMIDEIVELMTEVLCSKKESMTIASNTYYTQDVKSRFLKINSEHIEYVIDCMSRNTTKIGNIKQYLLATIFNAPSTFDSYYTTLVNHDLYG